MSMKKNAQIILKVLEIIGLLAFLFYLLQSMITK